MGIKEIDANTMHSAALALAAQVGSGSCDTRKQPRSHSRPPLHSQVSDADLARGSVYPPLANIREVSVAVAAAVAEDAYERGVADVLPRPADITAHIRASMWSPAYE